MAYSLEHVKALWALEMKARAKPVVPLTAYDKQVAASAAAHEASPTRVFAKSDRYQVSWREPSDTIALMDARARCAAEGKDAYKVGPASRIKADGADRVSRTDDEPAEPERASALRDLTQEAAWQAMGHVPATPVSAHPVPGANFSTVDLRRVQQVRESREAHLSSPTRVTATTGPAVKPE